MGSTHACRIERPTARCGGSDDPCQYNPKPSCSDKALNEASLDCPESSSSVALLVLKQLPLVVKMWQEDSDDHLVLSELAEQQFANASNADTTTEATPTAEEFVDVDIDVETGEALSDDSIIDMVTKKEPNKKVAVIQMIRQPHHLARLLDDIWTPELMITNGADSISSDINYNIYIYFTGIVMMETYSIYKVTCDIDVKNYPFDEQRCQMTISPEYGYGFVVKPQVIDIPLEKYFSVNGEWLLMDTDVSVIELRQPGIDHSYAEFNMILKRRSDFYVVSVIFPMILLSVMNCLVFLLPADSDVLMDVHVYIDDGMNVTQVDRFGGGIGVGSMTMPDLTLSVFARTSSSKTTLRYYRGQTLIDA
ncbi:neuronal acetylcholine receptor subunit alpha-9-like [Haliotis rubra]|uniref:neuronal acetylcholine receptor subunit alpha-9-like n=1 Tax=Haliotis rubra TaxID=36100 RepID=UPI001EE5FF74|nr:neuronal acetylcholine receptor subunit alpha-9-like [Haliotis rubra]